jgi:hypothetical protein
VTGIGPKLAVACLSGLKAEAFARAVVDNDVKKLSGIPGVGKRTAERLVLELQATNSRALTLGGAAAPAPAHRAHLDDLQSALCNLGYRAKDVEGPSSPSSLGGQRRDELSRGCCARRSSASTPEAPGQRSIALQDPELDPAVLGAVPLAVLLSATGTVSPKPRVHRGAPPRPPA